MQMKSDVARNVRHRAGAAECHPRRTISWIGSVHRCIVGTMVKDWIVEIRIIDRDSH